MSGPIKISQMTQASDVDGTEYFPIVQGGGNYKARVPVVNDYTALRAFVSGGFKHVFVADLNVGGHFIRDDSDVTSADNGGTILVAANGKRWKRVFDGQINIMWFIPSSEHAAIRAGTSTFDCSTAFFNALNSRTVAGLGILVLTSGPQIFFPAGKYYFGATLHLKIRCHLKGEVGGLQGGWATHFVFPAGTTGIVIHKENTDSTGTVAATTGADGTVIEDILLYGSSAAGGASAHGIWLRARASLIRVLCQAFGGNGFNIVATAGAGGFNEGNANCFLMMGCTGLANGLAGLFVDGADANAGSNMMFDASDNLGWGIYDSSFLGNTHMGCHSSGNGLGPYKSDNANARSMLLGCYAEGGQPPAEIINPAMALGGLQGSGFTAGTTGFVLDMDIGGAYVKNGLQMPTATIGHGQAATSGIGIRFIDTANVAPWTFEKTVGRWGWKWANAGVAGYIMYYDTTATPGNGYARDISAAAAPSGGNAAIGINSHYAGNFNEMKWRGFLADSTTAIPAFAHLVGDAYEYLTTVEGGHRGKVCITAGTPGTFREWGYIQGNGGTVTQITSKATGVTLNTLRGEIVTHNANLAATTVVSFTLTNSKIGANDTIIINRKSGGTAASYQIWVDSVAAGSAVVCIRNFTAGALAEALTLQFEVRPGAVA